jgi:hypothetical protein
MNRDLRAKSVQRVAQPMLSIGESNVYFKFIVQRYKSHELQTGPQHLETAPIYAARNHYIFQSSFKVLICSAYFEALAEARAARLLNTFA